MLNLPGSLNHPLRMALAGEMHSRPFLVFEAPACISHLAIHRGDRPVMHEELLASLCTRFGVAAPGPEARHFHHDFGHFRLKWERHSEFSTFSFIEPNTASADFESTAIRHVPVEWLESLQGSVMAASHIIIERGTPLSIADKRFKALFPVPPLVGSEVLNGGQVWTDFQIGPDGFSKFLLRDVGLREAQIGRLVQRLCEIETYVMMALLALPLAREGSAQLGEIEEDLAELGEQMSRLDIDGDAERPLREISRLDAQLRVQSFRTSYRFSAAQAYYRIVGARIGELREQRIEGVPTLGEFMERRLAPAMDTCLSMAARQEALASKIDRSNDMLRTRVNLAQERQTQSVLESLSRSAKLQLQLQQAVEGLSVVAISYYAIGLAGYALKALKGWGLDVAVDQSLGLLLPLVGGVVWLGLRRLHRRLHKPARNHSGDGAETAR